MPLGRPGASLASFGVAAQRTRSPVPPPGRSNGTTRASRPLTSLPSGCGSRSPGRFMCARELPAHSARLIRLRACCNCLLSCALLCLVRRHSQIPAGLLLRCAKLASAPQPKERRDKNWCGAVRLCCWKRLEILRPTMLACNWKLCSQLASGHAQAPSQACFLLADSTSCSHSKRALNSLLDAREFLCI